MSHPSFPSRRFTRGLGWTFVAVVLSAGSAIAASPAPPAPAQPATRGVPSPTEPGYTAHSQVVQNVSDALGQRLDRMMLSIKAPQTH